MPRTMRSNTSMLTCTLRRFRSHFQPAMALLSTSHISPLTSNTRHLRNLQAPTLTPVHRPLVTARAVTSGQKCFNACRRKRKMSKSSLKSANVKSKINSAFGIFTSVLVLSSIVCVLRCQVCFTLRHCYLYYTLRY